MVNSIGRPTIFRAVSLLVEEKAWHPVNRKTAVLGYIPCQTGIGNAQTSREIYRKAGTYPFTPGFTPEEERLCTRDFIRRMKTPARHDLRQGDV